MPSLIKMPALSPTMEKGTLSKWLKKENDKISAGDLICEIETDKATMELEAVDDGILGKILIPDNTENVLVTTPIAVLLSAGEKIEDATDLLSSIIKPTTAQTAPQTPKDVIPPPQPSQLKNIEQSERIFASPLAKRLANEQNISLQDVMGSGPNGRIIKRDIENYSSSTSQPNQKQETQKIMLSGMRKVIGKRLTEAKQNIPHFYLTIDINAERMLAMRALMNEQNKDMKITVNDIIIKATACGLTDIPTLNATFHDDYIMQYSQPDICVAVSIEGGLITPILSSVHTKNLRTISSEIKVLVEKAKNGKLKPEEYQGGTFTISNLGMFGIQHFQAIINPPQVAILAVGAVQQNGLMSLTLSVDHRAVDGSDAAKFLQKLKMYLEQPELMLV